MKPARLAALSLITVLLLADMGGAWYLHQLWLARHGGDGQRPAEQAATRTGSITLPDAAPHTGRTAS